MIDLYDVNVSFDGEVDVLAGISFTLEAGSCTLVTGAASVGKSTLLATSCGIVPQLVRPRHFSGEVRLHGEDVAGLDIGSLFQRFGIVLQAVEDQSWDLAVEDLIAFPLENAGVPRTEIRNRVQDMVDELECARLLGRKVSTLSGGEKRIAALASALIREPSVLVLDEPTSGLDPDACTRMVTILSGLHARGITLLIAEQNLSGFDGLAERVLFLGRHGNLVGDLPWKKALARADLFQAAGVEPPAGPAQAPQPLQRKTEQPPALTVSALQSRLRRPDGEPVLPKVDLEFHPGEIAALIGPNGAGKSTLLRCLLGLEAKARGEIRVNGDSTETLTVAERARHIGYLPQNVRRMFFLLSVLEEVVFSLSGGRTGQKAVSEHRDQAMTLLARVHLDNKAQLSPFMLSMREQLMLALACMEAADPALVVLDEPLIGWDNEWRGVMLEFLAGSRRAGRSTLLISHDLSLAHQAVDRLLIMRDGALAFDRPAAGGGASEACRSLGWSRPGVTPATVHADDHGGYAHAAP